MIIDNKPVYLAAILLCGVFALNAVVVPVIEVPLQVLKGNEGWNAFFAARAMNGLALYPSAPEMIVNNYPPLSFYIIGIFGRLVGDFILAGRIVSLVSFLTIAAILGIIVARRTGSWLAGLFTAAYFLAVFSVFPGGRIGLNDPQLLGHALMLGGFAIFWLGDGRFRSVLAGVALMVMAGLIKHNIIALPLAVTLWLAIYDPKQLLVWLGAVGLSVVIAAVGLIALWGFNSVESMLTPRVITVGKAATLIVELREMLPTLTVFILLCLFPRTRSPNRDLDFSFALVFVTTSFAVAFIAYSGEGVIANAAFDVVISVVLAIGLIVGALPAGREKTAIVVALVLAQYFMITPGIGTALGGSVSTRLQRDRLDIEYLTSQRGDAICTEPSLCYWAKKDFVFDSFNMDQLYTLGKRDPNALLDKLRHREIAVVVIENWNPRGRAWAVEFESVLDTFYRVDRISERRKFYVPKEGVVKAFPKSFMPNQN